MSGTILAKNSKDMVLIPAGTFIMGSEEYGPETPTHDVVLNEYYIDKYPVTNKEYKLFVDDLREEAPIYWKEREIPEGREDHPVHMISWNMASKYAEWAHKRLPSEAEWEKAARGTDGRRWPWGNRFDEKKTIVWENAIILDMTTTAVTNYPEGKSPYNIFQMGGHVEEWVEDWYSPYPGSKYESNCYGQQYKVLKGGSWFYTQQYARCSYRRCAKPDFSSFDDCEGPGFRCASDTLGKI
jgi:formylglycine-generating enzyme required for sulfatase activity